MSFDPIWASDENALIDVPSDAEQRTGFVCGPASPGRFNWIIQTIMSAINSLDISEMVSKFRAIHTAPGLLGGGTLEEDRTIRLNIPGLEPESSIANDDLIIIYDASEATHRKMTREDFVAGLTGGGGGGGDGITVGANIGTGAGKIYASVSGSSLQFRSIAAGDGISVAVAGNNVSVGLSNMAADLTYS